MGEPYFRLIICPETTILLSGLVVALTFDSPANSIKMNNIANLLLISFYLMV